MKNVDLDRLLRDLYEEDIASSSRHRLQTDQCPPLTMFPAGVKNGWPEEYRDHVPNCPYCQKVTAMEWEISHPSLFALAQHVAGTLRDREAMRIHLQDDQCEICTKRAKSWGVKRLAGLIREGKRKIEEIRSMADRKLVIVMEFALGASFASATEPLQRSRIRSNDGKLIGTLRVTPQGNLMVHAESPDRGDEGRLVRVELIRAGKPFRRYPERKMEDFGESGTGAEWDLGRADQFKESLEVDLDWSDE